MTPVDEPQAAPPGEEQRSDVVVRLPRWSRVALLLLPLDLCFVAWALVLHAHPERRAALILCCATLLFVVAFLIQCFAWVTVISFFARDRVRAGFGAAWLLLFELVVLVLVFWLVQPAFAG